MGSESTRILPPRPAKLGEGWGEGGGTTARVLLAFGLQVRLDEPQPLVNATGNLGEEVRSVGIAKFVALPYGLPNGLAEERQGR